MPELAFPFLDLKAEFAAMREEVLAAVARVLDSQHFILGPEVAAFEAEVAELVGCRFAIGCASGSDALLLALMALEIGPGDEVITTPFTFFATAGAIAQRGARPVFVDIGRDDFNLDPERIQAAITPRTKAIMPVHLFGLAAEMDVILETCSKTQFAGDRRCGAGDRSPLPRARQCRKPRDSRVLQFLPVEEPGRSGRWRNDHHTRCRTC